MLLHEAAIKSMIIEKHSQLQIFDEFQREQEMAGALDDESNEENYSMEAVVADTDLTDN